VVIWLLFVTPIPLTVMANARTETPVGAESWIATAMGVPWGAGLVEPEQPADKPHRIHKAVNPRVDIRIYL
jgi:hypothetical protein